LGVVEIVGTIILAVGGIYAARVGRSVKAVHEEVRTNHGKRAGEYLEMVPDMMKLLAEHTVQDADQFGQIAKRLDDLDAKVSAGW
jgi:hypothetical protein